MATQSGIHPPPADRVPTRRLANCRYCERYARACGRHELRPRDDMGTIRVTIVDHAAGETFRRSYRVTRPHSLASHNRVGRSAVRILGLDDGRPLTVTTNGRDD